MDIFKTIQDKAAQKGLLFAFRGMSMTKLIVAAYPS